ncbi:MAG: UvrD-helicase domain-containing protein [Halofilum sp. (in: g-proteobacteria)]|nr:UvrD-helicase domain-containing protein [Halofilum sp. (in: g-proteobacteria)]
MADLNPQQRAAVRHVGTPLLVLAGAGSGKTRVITTKIAHLVRTVGLPGHGVFAVTFTNKAAREMKERAARTLSGEAAKGISVSTFHTLGLRLLRADGHALGYRRGFTIMDATDSLTAIKELVRGDAGGNLGDEDALRAIISRWKNDFVTAAQAPAVAADEAEARAAAVYARYEQLLHAYNAVDFDDLIIQPVRLLGEHPEIREKWQNRVRHLLVDEYQDTNGAQYELVRLLVGAGGGLTAVGDDDQSVYAWRGARPENLARLEQDFPRIEVIKLEQNYRSMGRILRAANHLIGHNPHVFEKRLWSELGAGDPVRIVSCPSGEDEADRIAAEILSKRLRGGTDWREFAILYRGNFQSKPFEKALRERNIPYRVSGSASFFDRAEIKDILAYARLLVNPDDDTAFLRVINTPRRHIGASTLEKLGHYARNRGVSMLAASFELGLAEHVAGTPLRRLQEFGEWIVAVGDNARRGDPVAVFRQVVEDIGYRGWLDDIASDPRAAQKRWDNVEELLEWIGRMASDADGDERDLAAIVSRLTLMDMLDRADDEDAGDCVSLMTLHAAKGLEFPHVFVAGMEEEVLPHRSSLAEDRLNEERRLAYVGVTRAQRSLTLTFAEKRRRWGEEVTCEPSRFLEELPADEVVWEGTRAPADPETRRATGREQLANLRALLGEG